MAVAFLCNTIGHVASAAGINFGSLVSGYNAYDAMSGPRNKTVRGGAGAATHRYQYDCPSSEVTHVVVSRMDLFKNTLDADEVVVEYSSSHTVDSTTAVEDLELVGPTYQDWVKPIARTSASFSVAFNSTAITREYEYGKVYFAKAFSFGTEPAIGQRLRISRAERVQSVRPCMGYKGYAVEAEFDLAFAGVTLAKILEFEALPLHSPLFFYDNTGDLFAHKLEHVIIAKPWTWERVAADSFNIALSLSRLAHYP